MENAGAIREAALQLDFAEFASREFTRQVMKLTSAEAGMRVKRRQTTNINFALEKVTEDYRRKMEDKVTVEEILQKKLVTRRSLMAIHGFGKSCPVLLIEYFERLALPTESLTALTGMERIKEDKFSKEAKEVLSLLK